MRLDGKVALVTGGGTGIGQATAEALANEGAQVVVTGRRAAMLEEACAAIRAPRPVRSYATDVGDRAQVNDMVDWIRNEYDAVDILVNNAGILGTTQPIEQISGDEWDRLMAVNLGGVFDKLEKLPVESAPEREPESEMESGG